jgi:hypothetical protein
VGLAELVEWEGAASKLITAPTSATTVTAKTTMTSTRL